MQWFLFISKKFFVREILQFCNCRLYERLIVDQRDLIKYNIEFFFESQCLPIFSITLKVSDVIFL